MKSKIETTIKIPFKPRINRFIRGEFDTDATPNKPWKLASEAYELKISAISKELGLFVKAYALTLSKYSELAHQALIELSKLQLPIPVLTPLVVHNTFHYFTLGTTGKIYKPTEIYTKAQIQQIEDIIRKFGLTPTISNKFNPRFMKAETTKIKGQRFLIDPIDDSISKLFQFKLDTTKE